MSSKKGKKRKVKCCKRLKCGKIKKIIRKKRIVTKFNDDSFSEEHLNLNKWLQNRCVEEVGSLSFDTEEASVPKLKDFAQMRERYFSYLQRVVTGNCAFCQNQPSITTLESLSLEIEQEALLASLRAELYVKSISKIINEIEKCTEKGQINEEVQKLLPKAIAKSQMNIIVKESLTVSPKISSTYTSNVYNDHDKRIMNHFNDSSDDIQKNHSFSNSYAHPNLSPQNDGSLPAVSNNQENNQCDDDKAKRAINRISISPDFGASMDCQAQDFSSPNSPTECDNPNFSCRSEPDSVNPIYNSLNQLQKSVKETLNASDKILKQKAEEKERAYIAHILEGDDSTCEHSDSFSDNANDSKENIYEDNFMNRIEKMREIFGFEEPSSDEKKPMIVNKSREKRNNFRSRRSSIWKHERVIQQYKYALLATQMSSMRQTMNKILFRQLFGDDSDDEHEARYICEETFRSSCTERISSWVVKHLMPFYNDRRIVGRNIFKNLGHYISDVIVDEIQYPDEWTVKYYVSKFFPTRKRYVCDADILSFQLD